MPGQIIYQGPSLLNSAPIIVVAITSTRNPKTGDMLQTYILHQNVDPVTASRRGHDYAICGDCPHRGVAHDGPKGFAKGRSCYVNLGQGPLAVFRSFKKGNYPLTTGHDALRKLGAERMVRIGTYGDGAAAPRYIWDSLCTDATGWTAYTHQNATLGAELDPARYMTSADSPQQALSAWKRGERTFRVISSPADLIPGQEILCPASEEMGKRTTCAKCKLCAGNSVDAKSIAIVAHGSGASNFKGSAA